MTTAWWFLLVWFSFGGDEWRATVVEQFDTEQGCTVAVDERRSAHPPEPIQEWWFTCAKLPPGGLMVNTCMQGACATVLRPELMPNP